MTSSRRYSVARKLIGVLAIVAAGSLAACTEGDTDGGSAVGNLGTGSTPVSDGGFGAKLTLTIDGVTGDASPTIDVGQVVEFSVQAQDPRGAALAFQRVFCESEKGIAILEPSSGGVAFEHTNRNGFMSGFIGCITKGSFLMECRVEEGFNLKARQHVRCVGEGSASFPGAAGGNIGGGNLVEDVDGATGATGADGATGDTGATGT